MIFMLDQLSNISSQAMSTLTSKTQLVHTLEHWTVHQRWAAISSFPGSSSFSEKTQTDLWRTVSSRHVSLSLHDWQEQDCAAFGSLHLAWSTDAIPSSSCTLTQYPKPTTNSLLSGWIRLRLRLRLRINVNPGLKNSPLINLALKKLVVNNDKKENVAGDGEVEASQRAWWEGKDPTNSPGLVCGESVLDKGLHDPGGLLMWICLEWSQWLYTPLSRPCPL